MSFSKGDNPFGALIILKGLVIAQSENYAVRKRDITCHAEIEAIRKAQKIMKKNNLSDCEIYSNCEPCPMCSFVIRESRIRRVVYSIISPYMGGVTKWKILTDTTINDKFPVVFFEPPKITVGCLKQTAENYFEKIGWSNFFQVN